MAALTTATSSWASNIKDYFNDMNAALPKIDAIKNPTESFVMNLEVHDHNNNSKVTLFVGAKDENSFAIYKAPRNQRGQIILNSANNLWMSMPKANNPIKISESQKLLGNASIADIVSFLYAKNYKVNQYSKAGQIIS